MDLYDLLFADQELEPLLLEIELPPGSPLAVARARLWEGRYEEAASIAAGTDGNWSSLLVSAARIRAGLGAKRTLLALAEDPDRESRMRLWAWTALRKIGEKPSPFHASEVLGVVLEVPTDVGLDVLAVYADGGVRFLGSGGNAIVMQPEQGPSQAAYDVLVLAHDLAKVPPAPRVKHPVKPDHVRLNALTALGVHTVEAPWSELDPPGKHADLFTAGAKLLQEITAA